MKYSREIGDNNREFHSVRAYIRCALRNDGRAFEYV